MQLAGRLGQLACVWVSALALAGAWALATRPDATASPAAALERQAAAAGRTDAELSEEMLAGIPQDGTSLGDPDAPVVITEFADLQCPFCRDYALGVLPRLIEDKVRTGEVRLELRLLRFLGPDSQRLAAVAAGAAAQDRLWNVVDLMFRRQGAENSGYATDAYLRDLLADVPRLDARRALAPSRAAGALLTTAAADAQAFQIDSTPAFLVTQGDRTRRLELDELTYEAFTEALAEATR